MGNCPADLITWITPDNESIDLSGNWPINYLDGRVGAFMPPVLFTEERIPERSGARLRQTLFDIRELELPVVFVGTDLMSVRRSLRDFLHHFDPLRGNGTLRVTDGEGATRELTCRYEDGLRGEEVAEIEGETFLKATLIFRAVDPLWLGAAVTIAYDLGATPALFFPFFPLVLTASSVFANTTVVNPGDREAYPIWTITGPGSDIVLRNMTYSEEINLPVTLTGAQALVIDTSFSEKTIIRNDGANLFSSLTNTSVLWTLRAGTNQIRLEMNGANVSSRITLTYYPRYLGA
jgi:hypothetical protein